jgi:Na+-driven multidrug efflux pump
VNAFTPDPGVREYATQGLRVVSAGFPFYAYGMVLTSSFNGAGDTWTPTLLNLFCFWLWEVPLAWVLSKHFGWGPVGVFASIAVFGTWL